MLLLTLGASVIGYFAYRNLNHIVSTLEDEVKPNLDLIILGQVSIELGRMEDAIEGYVFNQDTAYMSDFKERTQRAIAHLDELRERNTDPSFGQSIDSLENLILNKVTVLNQAAHLDILSVEETLSAIPRLEGVQGQQSKPNTIPDTSKQKKIGFLQKLLGKKEKPLVTDSTAVRAEKQLVQINAQLDSLARRAQKKVYNQKIREFTLYQDHQDIDGDIIALIKDMEAWQISRIKFMTMQTQDRVRYTNRYITIFSVMASVILLITLTVLIIYVLRTRSHQMVLDHGRKNALKMAKEKEEFLANMSHEIRTPMNAIAGFSKVLLQSKLSTVQKEQVSIIDKSSNHLIHILNDVLDFSRLQSGKIRLDVSLFDPSQVIEEAVQLLSQKAKEKQLELGFELQGMPARVSGDAFRLRQILLNLIFNSIKFTEEGSVQVHASFASDTLRIAVRDTGVGIPVDMQQKIFDEFEQVNKSDKQVGTGLGLSITKKLVDIHEGSIRLESELGRGTTFTIALPYVVVEQEVEEASESQLRFDLTGMHVLLADDEPFNVQLLQTILDAQSITYDVGRDGQQTYDLLCQNVYDVLLLDFRMPKMSGPEVATRLRQGSGPNANIPIVGLTATVSDHDQKTAQESGINHVIRKPFEPEELFRLMAKYTIRKKGQGIKHNVSVPYSMEGLSKMGDTKFVVDMTETFIHSTQENIQQFEAMVSQEDGVGAADALHKIIAPARHFKLMDLVGLLKETELSARSGETISSKRVAQIKEETHSVIEALQLYLQER
ncbi:hypothetical protein BFP72_06640 [Reichenbachiella sp. 5M10]|nr:hypothetical protein BFP72_06640 [Reichenbachiella sp. 5M10]